VTEKKQRGGARKGAGRPKGVPNKITTDLRQAVINAYDKAGGEEYLAGLARDEPKTFATLMAKVIPSENINRNYDMSAIQGRLNAARERAANANKARSKDAKQEKTIRRRA